MPWCPVLPSCAPLLLTPLPSCANYYPPLPLVPISHQLCSHLIVLTLPLPSVVVQNSPFSPPLICSLNLLVAFFSFQPHCNWPIISGLIKQNLMTLWEWDVKSKIKKEYLCSLIATRAELQNRYASHCLENLTLWIQQLCLWDLCWVVCCLCTYMTCVVLSCMLPVCVFIAYGVEESHHSCSGHQGLQQVWEEGALPHTHGYKVPPTFLPNTLKSHIGA